MAAESTAINALIHLAQGRRIDEDEDPVPELFSMTPPKSVPQRTVGMPAQPQPMAPATPPRVASGTKPPMIAAATIIAPPVSIAPATPSIPAAPVSRKVVYRAAPVVEQEDEQTELWNNAEIRTAPAVPAIAPHIATVIAQTATAPVVPSILRGPTAPSPDPRIMQAARAAHEAAVQRSIDPRVDAAAAARHAASKAQPAPAPRAIDHPVSRSPQYPAIRMTAAMASVPRTPTAPPASYLVARELLSSAMRWGGLAVIAVIALGVGAYLAFASKSDDKPEAPTDRDRAIAIMNGTAQPEPETTVVKAPAPTVVAAPEVVTTAYKASEPEPVKVTAQPIEEPAEAVADDTVDVADIELEAAEKPAKRAARSARAARKAKAVAETNVAPARAGSDPVLAILAEKSKPSTKPVVAEKPKTKDKPVKEASLASATEIAAPRGAAAAKGNGKLSISSDKAALIYVDGRPTGKSAPSAFVITAGDHQITLLDPATKKAKTATVQIAVNKTVSIRKDFN